MKNKKLSFLFLLALLTAFISKTHAQIDQFINANDKELAEMKHLKLIVEVKEEDPKLVQKLSKKPKDAERLQNYRNFISQNNIMLKAAVDKYWKFNSSIEYKTTSEINDMDGKKGYLILSYVTLGDLGEEGMFSNLSIPIIAINRSERGTKKMPDNYCYLPPSSIPQKENSPSMWTYEQSGYDFAIRELQENTNWMIQNHKKKIFEDYAADQAKKNCGDIHKGTLLIDRGQLYEKTQESDIKSSYKGPYELTDTKTADDAFVNEEQGKEVVFMCAYGVAHGAFGGSALFFSKVVVDCSTGKILYYYKASGFGVMYVEFDLRKPTFEDMEKCK